MANRGRHKQKPMQHLIARILGEKIANRMMECQKAQGNQPDLDVFLNTPSADRLGGGFTWVNTKEGHEFWDQTLTDTLRCHPLYKQYMNDRR